MLVVGKYYRYNGGPVYKVINIYSHKGKKVDLEHNDGLVSRYIDYQYFLENSKLVNKCKIYYNVNRKAL